ncbi:MAG: heat shock protein HtpX [Nitrospirae bacterium]|nr:MAG: heat shock protein HtpX [Nitrospirota bacterium]
MPLTFIEIEKQKNWRIGILFIVLLLLYFCITLSLIQGFYLVFFHSVFILGGINWTYLLIIMAFSLTFATIHFLFSAFGAVKSVMHHLGATFPDAEDNIHKRLINIMDEIHVVTGNKKKIKCMVVPSLSMNALAVADLNGDAAVMITEGLLSRLSRTQLEAVMAHEAYHILSGDCLETTVAASFFGMYASMLEKIKDFGEENGRGFHPAFLLFWILLKLSQILNMFISREREYRADAASVRMTRNPLSMAEALHLISRNWTGIGFIGNGLEMLCIVSPQATSLNESEGWWADLMSTHPPIRKRMKILLSMASTNIAELDAKLNREAATANMKRSAEPVYYALDPKQQWQGPFSIADLSSLPWLSPLTWVKSVDEQTIDRAWRNPLIDPIFTARLSQKENEITDIVCPHCNQALITIPYEKTRAYQCRFCSGILVENDKIPRIIARREVPCTDRLKSLAKAVLTDNQRRITINKLRSADTKTKSSLPCPKCRRVMFRTFYSLAYLIEIDRCGLCCLTWFDTDELEILQCLIENKIIPNIGILPV